MKVINIKTTVIILSILVTISSCKKSQDSPKLKTIGGTYRSGVLKWWPGSGYNIVDSTFNAKVDSNKDNSINITIYTTAQVPVTKTFHLNQSNKYVGKDFVHYTFSESTITHETLYKGHSTEVTIEVYSGNTNNALSFNYDSTYNGTNAQYAIGVVTK